MTGDFQHFGWTKPKEKKKSLSTNSEMFSLYYSINDVNLPMRIRCSHIEVKDTTICDSRTSAASSTITEGHLWNRRKKVLLNSSLSTKTKFNELKSKLDHILLDHFC